MPNIPNRINEVIVEFSPAVKAIVDAMQTEFETYLHRRENFGPLFKKKLGIDHPVPGHNDHIHFSVN